MINSSFTHDLKLNPLKGSGCWIRSSAEDFGSCQEFVVSNPESLPDSLSEFASRTFTVGNKEKGNFFLDQRNILEMLNLSIYNGYPTRPPEQFHPSRFLINRNITEFTELLSESMTNYIRMGPGSVRNSGTAFRDEAFMIVDWLWFAYPAGCFSRNLLLHCSCYYTEHRWRRFVETELPSTGSVWYPAPER